jgi:RES domain-containing protein
VKLWRLTRAPFVALDGTGAAQYGSRYASPGRPLVNFASEAGLAILVALRYLPEARDAWPEDHVLGWTQVDAIPERVPDADDETAIRQWVDQWLDARRSLLAAVRSKVLPEGDIVMMNPLHPDAAAVPPLRTRPFNFADCLHEPPMLARYRQGS